MSIKKEKVPRKIDDPYSLKGLFLEFLNVYETNNLTKAEKVLFASWLLVGWSLDNMRGVKKIDE